MVSEPLFMTSEPFYMLSEPYAKRKTDTGFFPKKICRQLPPRTILTLHSRRYGKV